MITLFVADLTSRGVQSCEPSDDVRCNRYSFPAEARHFSHRPSGSSRATERIRTAGLLTYPGDPKSPPSSARKVPRTPNMLGTSARETQPSESHEYSHSKLTPGIGLAQDAVA